MRKSSSGVMNTDILLRQQRAGDTNWWIEGRREKFRKSFANTRTQHPTSALEIGPGAGNNLGIFQELGVERVFIADADSEALEMCRSVVGSRAALVDASSLPFADETFDFLLLGDVLEHVPNDKVAAKEVVRVLKKNGRAVITVPAYMILWSEHDRQAGHQRRYRVRELLELFAEEDVEIVEVGYFNWFLFLPTLVTKKLLNIFRPHIYADATVVSGRFNSLLRFLFLCDIWIASRVPIPFGISISLVFDKRAQFVDHNAQENDPSKGNNPVVTSEQ